MGNESNEWKPAWQRLGFEGKTPGSRCEAPTNRAQSQGYSVKWIIRKTATQWQPSPVTAIFRVEDELNDLERGELAQHEAVIERTRTRFSRLQGRSQLSGTADSTGQHIRHLSCIAMNAGASRDTTRTA